MQEKGGAWERGYENITALDSILNASGITCLLGHVALVLLCRLQEPPAPAGNGWRGQPATTLPHACTPIGPRRGNNDTPADASWKGCGQQGPCPGLAT